MNCDVFIGVLVAGVSGTRILLSQRKPSAAQKVTPLFVALHGIHGLNNSFLKVVLTSLQYPLYLI